MTIEPAYLRDFARRYTAAWCSHDASSVASFYSPNGSLAINGGTPAVGRSAIAEAAQGFMSAFPDLQVLMDDLIIQGDLAEYRWTLIGTNTGPGGTGHRGELADAEQVRPPTMSRIVAGLERARLVRRHATEDGRRVRLAATAKGTKIMWEGRKRRAESLARASQLFLKMSCTNSPLRINSYFEFSSNSNLGRCTEANMRLVLSPGQQDTPVPYWL